METQTEETPREDLAAANTEQLAEVLKERSRKNRQLRHRVSPQHGAAAPLAAGVRPAIAREARVREPHARAGQGQVAAELR